MRRRLLRAAARRAEKLQILREANRASDTVQVKNADVSMLKTTEAPGIINNSALGRNTARTREQATKAPDVSSSAIEENTRRTRGDKEMYADIGLASRIPPIVEAMSSTASAPASALPHAVHTSRQNVQHGSCDPGPEQIADAPPDIVSAAQVGRNINDPGQENISGAPRAVEGAGQVTSEYRQKTGRTPAMATPGVGKDEHVRRYVQGFRGLSSAYGDYSSVFGSQVSKFF